MSTEERNRLNRTLIILAMTHCDDDYQAAAELMLASLKVSRVRGIQLATIQRAIAVVWEILDGETGSPKLPPPPDGMAS